MEKIFYLSKEQIGLSKEYYNGKVIKCLIAPYHSYSELKDIFKENVHIFPERDMSKLECNTYISDIVENELIEEVVIVTSDYKIISDMINPCVRVLTMDEKIVVFPFKTFRANLLELETQLFSNDEHEEFITPEVETHADKVISELIDDMNKHIEEEIPMSKEEFDSMGDKIEMIADSFLKCSLSSHSEKIKIK